MARSPFQGTFQPNARPTIATSPDALVYFNGEAEAIGCPECSRRFDFNRYITSIQTDLSVDSAPGSANISLSIPRHTIDDFYFDGVPVITPMMEVEIFAKGYYLVEGLPQYYPIFWGLVTEVGDSYSSGEHTVSIHCADILKWWDLCKMNINPAYGAPAGQQGITLFGNVFEQANPYDIIFTLASHSFGDVIVGANSVQAVIREETDQQLFSAALSDMMLYWAKRFSRMRSNLVLYGTTGVAVRGATIYQEYSKNPGATANKQLASTIMRNANGGRDSGPLVLDPAGNKVTPYKRVYANAGMGLVQSEYQPKLELANAAKEVIGFEFFMDVTGDIVFKPPFYNLDVLGNKPISWVQDIDIIDWDFSESESEVITQIMMEGSITGTENVGAENELINPKVTVTDYHLLRKYGWRPQAHNAEIQTDPIEMFYHGLDVLDRINSRRHRGSVTIPLRPELRLGFPIYLAPKDQVWYLSGISHSIQFGGRATTTLQLSAKRSKFIAPRGTGDIKLTSFNGKEESDKDGLPRTYRFSAPQLQQYGKFTLDASNALEMPADNSVFETRPGAQNLAEPLILRHPKTGRIVGYPNVVLAYTRPFTPTDIHNQAGEKTNSFANPQISSQEQAVVQERRALYETTQADKLTTNRNAVLEGRYLSGTFQYGLNAAGAFVYAHDSSAGGGVISEALLVPVKNVTVKGQKDLFDKVDANPMALIRPISDERGFELIGHYQYGRRVALRDGRLIVDNFDKKVRVDLQLALSGELGSMLAAQSQGLTSVTTGYADPGSTLATMTPDESETAAVLAGTGGNPNTRTPQFVDAGDLYLPSAPLGTPRTEPSVEVSQLSRALTLAEMAVKEEIEEDGDCVCLTGRADLAFMSKDYQVKVLSGTATPDTSTLPDGSSGAESAADLDVARPIDTGATPQAVRKLEARVAMQRARADELKKQAVDSGGDPVSVQLLIEAEKRVVSLQQTQLAVQSQLDEQQSHYNSSSSIFTKTNSEVVSKVEQFLTKLYTTLDDAHQQFESAIRGDLLAHTNADFSNLNAAATNPPSEFAPPFSAPNRFMLGDPNAAVGSVQTNAQNIANAWNNFGKDLRANSEARALTTQISQDKASVARLTATRDQLIKQRDSKVVVIGVDVQAQIDSLSAQIVDLQKELAQNQAKLSVLT